MTPPSSNILHKLNLPNSSVISIKAASNPRTTPRAINHSVHPTCPSSEPNHPLRLQNQPLRFPRSSILIKAFNTADLPQNSLIHPSTTRKLFPVIPSAQSPYSLFSATSASARSLRFLHLAVSRKSSRCQQRPARRTIRGRRWVSEIRRKGVLVRPERTLALAAVTLTLALISRHHKSLLRQALWR